MTVHFCPHCGRLNLADFIYCPYCGREVAPPGPDLADALEKPFDRLEASSRDAAASARVDAPAEAFARLAGELDCLERDMEELISSRREGAAAGGSRE